MPPKNDQRTSRLAISTNLSCLMIVTYWNHAGQIRQQFHVHMSTVWKVWTGWGSARNEQGSSGLPTRLSSWGARHSPNRRHREHLDGSGSTHSRVVPGEKHRSEGDHYKHTLNTLWFTNGSPIHWNIGITCNNLKCTDLFPPFSMHKNKMERDWQSETRSYRKTMQNAW